MKALNVIPIDDIVETVKRGLEKNVRDPQALEAYIQTHKFDITKKPPENSAVLFYKGIKIGSRGNIVAITGKSKSRKTVVASAFATSFFLAEEEFLGFSSTLGEDEKILHVDTEQGYEHYYESVKRIFDNAGLTEIPERFHSVHTRDADIELRLDLIEYMLDVLKPGAVIIDGATDLVYDLNSQEEAVRVGERLLRWSFKYNALFIVVIHTTKTTGYMTGAIGTYLEKKCESALKVEKGEGEDEKYSHVSCQYSRNKSFDAFTIEYSEERSRYVIVNEQHIQTKGKGGRKDPSGYSDDVHADILRRIFAYTHVYTDMDLVGKIMHFTPQVTKDKINAKTARSFMKYYSEKTWIFCNAEGGWMKIEQPKQISIFDPEAGPATHTEKIENAEPDPDYTVTTTDDLPF